MTFLYLTVITEFVEPFVTCIGSEKFAHGHYLDAFCYNKAWMKKKQNVSSEEKNYNSLLP